MGLQSTFEEFNRLLQERLVLGRPMTEDTIRYTLYFALTTSGGLKHTDLTLEYPHPTLPGAKVDTVIREVVDRDSCAFEFKYDRANRGGSNQNRTQRAGKALVDLFRLAKVPDEVAAVKYFVYVTDPEMAGYFRNPKNQLHALFELAEGAEYRMDAESFLGFSPTLTAIVLPLAADCIIARVFAANLPANHCIRIFKVSTSRVIASSALASIASTEVPARKGRSRAANRPHLRQSGS